MNPSFLHLRGELINRPAAHRQPEDLVDVQDHFRPAVSSPSYGSLASQNIDARTFVPTVDLSIIPGYESKPGDSGASTRSYTAAFCHPFTPSRHQTWPTPPTPHLSSHGVSSYGSVSKSRVMTLPVPSHAVRSAYFPLDVPPAGPVPSVFSSRFHVYGTNLLSSPTSLVEGGFPLLNADGLGLMSLGPTFAPGPPDHTSVYLPFNHPVVSDAQSSHGVETSILVPAPNTNLSVRAHSDRISRFLAQRCQRRRALPNT